MARKAILFGINRYQRVSHLRGCGNDVRNVQSLLVDIFGLSADMVRTRIDEQVTKREVQKQWKWLLGDATAGDQLVFHFSGHGSYTADIDGDEDDGVDELLCLYNMDWDDGDSYLLDDDLREMSEAIPPEVSVTFVLDCCHSGTGTRLIHMPDGTDETGEAERPIADIRSTVGRYGLGADTQDYVSSPGIETAVERFLAPETASDAQRTVLARFVPPPPHVAARKRRVGVKRPLFALREKAMNHVLFTGSRSDQTSADAYIAGDFHGAFTYYFCKSLRQHAGRVDHQTLIRAVRERLAGERFAQIPQLEPNEARGFVFGGASAAGDEGSLGRPGQDEAISEEASVQSLLQRIVDLLERRTAGPVESGGGDRHLVYVHGICRHEAGYSDPWWGALSRHLSIPTRAELAANRHEVLWSEIVSPERVFAEARDAIETGDERLLAEAIRAVLYDRTARQATAGVAEQPPEGEPVASEVIVDRAALGIPGLNCVDDFVKYLANDQIRDEVLNAFCSVVAPLLRVGASIDIISHSWGTIVAYEGLRSLEGDGLRGNVRTLFTVGSALSINPVQRQLRWQDGRRPRFVRQWINLDAKGDIVGGALRPAGFRVDAEYLNLDPTACKSFLGVVAPACAHSSYFRPENVAVNAGIFAERIDE